MEDKIIKSITKKTKKSYIKVYFDYLFCHVIYGATKEDYQNFQMYQYTTKERKTIITTRKNKKLIQKNNDKNAYEVLDNKILFHQKFKKLIKLDWMILTKENLEQFEEFVKKHPVIIAKFPNHSGIEKMKVMKKDIVDTYKRLYKEHKLIIEEVIEQHEVLSKLHPYSINTIHIVTLKNNVVAAYLKIGVNKNIVDNLESGALLAPINISTGIIDYPAIDQNHQSYERHPLSKEEIVWLQIPKWPRIKRLCENASKMIPEIGYASFDVCMGKKDPILLKGNAKPSHKYYQWKSNVRRKIK